LREKPEKIPHNGKAKGAQIWRFRDMGFALICHLKSKEIPKAPQAEFIQKKTVEGFSRENPST